MPGLIGPLAFDEAAQRAKRDIQDALGLNRAPMPQMPQQPRVQAQMMPQGMQVTGQVPMGQNQLQMGMQTQGMKPQDLMARYATPNQSFGVNYQPQNNGMMMSYGRRFNEGGLAVKPTQAFAKGGLAMAEGGAWTRKEGKNPEGGLNAKGRASLRAQGHDIKPPVSAKQAKKSPKAAARRKSFCARSAGQAKMFPDAARDPNSRLNKARRKWDC